MRKTLIVLASLIVLAGCSAEQPAPLGTSEQPTQAASDPVGSESATSAPAPSTSQPEPEPQEAYTTISAKEAKELMDSGVLYTLVDVRTLAEYREERIPGSILIPYDEIATRAELELLDKDELIVVYCRSGARAQAAAQSLVDLGYTQVNTMGGILKWSYETVSG